MRTRDNSSDINNDIKTTTIAATHVAANERVNIISTFSCLPRLCTDAQVCFDVLRLGGADRLVHLCKNPAERNYSDAVLVACLAVLRR